MVAGKLSPKVYASDFLNSGKYLHLAAVFACNFANHMYALSAIYSENIISLLK